MIRLGLEPKTGLEQIVVECFRGLVEGVVYQQHTGPIPVGVGRKLVAVIRDARTGGTGKPDPSRGISQDQKHQDGADVAATEFYIGDVQVPRHGAIYSPRPNTTGSASPKDIIEEVLENINKVIEKQQTDMSPSAS